MFTQPTKDSAAPGSLAGNPGFVAYVERAKQAERARRREIFQILRDQLIETYSTKTNNPAIILLSTAVDDSSENPWVKLHFKSTPETFESLKLFLAKFPEFQSHVSKEEHHCFISLSSNSDLTEARQRNLKSLVNDLIVVSNNREVLSPRSLLRNIGLFERTTLLAVPEPQLRSVVRFRQE